MKKDDLLLTTGWEGGIGVAREDITPPVGINSRAWGAAKHDVSEGTHRPLTLTAIAIISADKRPLILMGIDFGVWRSPQDEWHVRGAILETFGLEESRVLVALSHTHAGPSNFREDTSRPGTDLIAPYLDRVRNCAVEAVRVALTTAKPARLSWRYGRCDLAKNRDLPVTDGSRFLVGYNPGEPADDTLLVGRIEATDDGKLLGVIVNYACHPTTLAYQNRLISPDYPGAMRELVERETGALCLFLQGASGELAPAEQYVGDTAVADRNGRRLAHAVLMTLEQWPERCLEPAGEVDSGAPLATMRAATPPSSGELAARCAPIDLALKPIPSLAELEQQWRSCPAGAAKERLWRKKSMRKWLGDDAVRHDHLWAWRIGEALIVAQRNELYSAAQLELRRRFSPRPVAVLNLANGCSSYLPPAPLYLKDQYAVNLTPFAAGGLERVIAAAAVLGQSLWP